VLTDIELAGVVADDDGLGQQATGLDASQKSAEVAAVFRGCGAEPGEMTVTDLGAEAVVSFVAGSRVIYRDPGGIFKPGPQHLIGFVEE
jgi:hypothetical protein